eukprot:4426489-Amphidinium_carterae.1
MSSFARYFRVLVPMSKPSWGGLSSRALPIFTGPGVSIANLVQNDGQTHRSNTNTCTACFT